MFIGVFGKSQISSMFISMMFTCNIFVFMFGHQQHLVEVGQRLWSGLIQKMFTSDVTPLFTFTTTIVVLNGNKGVM